MEVIHGSIYVEVESVFGLFPVAAAPASLRDDRSAASQNPSHAEKRHSKHRTDKPSGGSARNSGSATDSTEAPSYEKSTHTNHSDSASTSSEDDGTAQQRQMSSHSPFGPTTTSAFTFADLPPARPRGRTAAGESAANPNAAASTTERKVNFGHDVSGSEHRRELSSPGVSTSVYPGPTIDAPYPPSITVHFGKETHLIDMQSPAVVAAAAAATSAGGALSPSLSDSPHNFLVSPTRGAKAAAAAAASTRVDVADSLQPSRSLEAPHHQMSASSGGSSRASQQSTSLAPWEAVMDIVNDAESEMEDGSVGLLTPQQLSASTPPRSFQCESVSSTTENEELQQQQQQQQQQQLRGAAARQLNFYYASPSSPSGYPLPVASRAPRGGRVVVVATPSAASPIFPAAPQRHVTLMWLADHLRNDDDARESIRWTGPLRHSAFELNTFSTSGSAAAAAAAAGGGGGAAAATTASAGDRAALSRFAAAWYARMFPSDHHSSGANVLADDAQRLQSARRELRAHFPQLTAAVFPLCQRYAFTNTVVEVKSGAAFDLQDAMLEEKHRRAKKGSREAREAEERVNAGCLVLHIATPAELKKARKASSPRRSSGVFKKSRAVESFFEQLRDSFKGKRGKEKALSSTENSFTEDGEGHRQSPSHHTQHHLHREQHHPSEKEQRLSQPSSNLQSPSASQAVKEEGSGNFSALKKEGSKEDVFAVRLHISRLLSPSIRAWMKSRRSAATASASADGDEESEEGEESIAEINGEDVFVQPQKREKSGGAGAGLSPGGAAQADPDRPAVFHKSVYLPLPLPSENDASRCVAMMVKVNVLFKPGFDSAEPF